MPVDAPLQTCTNTNKRSIDTMLFGDMMEIVSEVLVFA